MKKLVSAAIIVFALSNMTSVLAGDPEVAANKAKTLCAGCHGPEGISIIPSWPNIAGQKEQYLIKVIKDYRDGVRPDPNMAPIAQTLSDEDIEDLAAYFSGL